MLSLDDLALEGTAGRYTRTLEKGWSYADRIFGGYTAGLALAAARRESPHPDAVSTHVAFLEAARPGRLALEVSTLRGGRRTWFGNVVALQQGRPVLTCTTWFGERGMSQPAQPATPRAPGNPDFCTSLAWLPEMWPCVGFLEERAIDYPGGPDETGGPRRVELWARAAKPLDADPFLAQALDLMLADAHTLDSALRPTGLAATFGVSLDLTVSWERPARATDWLRLTGEAGPAEDGFVSCTGAIHDRNGNLRASVQTNGRILSGA